MTLGFTSFPQLFVFVSALISHLCNFAFLPKSFLFIHIALCWMTCLESLPRLCFSTFLVLFLELE